MPDRPFDPVRDVANSQLILVDGRWPNFHDADIHRLDLWRGDIRPEDNVWTGPRVTVELELCALRRPFVTILEFSGLEAFSLEGFSSGNSIYDLSFSWSPAARCATVSRCCRGFA